jgi:hypothetical protein
MSPPTVERVQFFSAARKAVPTEVADPSVDVTGGWRATTWLGAPAPGGLALPAAHPTASWMYAPRGVHLGQLGGQLEGHQILVVADTGNHRVMIWLSVPNEDEQPCDVVLGQPDADSEGPACGGTSTAVGMFLPTGVLVHEGRLIVADAWHHRILIWNAVPTTGNPPADVVLGQDDLEHVEANRGGDCAANTLYWPFGINVVGSRFYVTDTGNRRVLGWSGGVPTTDVAPDLILGQDDATGRDENRGADATAASFRWPHGIAGTSDLLLIADAGNHRVLGWAAHPAADSPADSVRGQTDFATVSELPYAPQTGATLRFPYAIDVHRGELAVSDTANNRVLLWDTPSAITPAAVLGQPTFSANGENRWDLVGRDTLCWPYGLSLRDDTLAVADSGNNRVVLWRRERR